MAEFQNFESFRKELGKVEKDKTYTVAFTKTPNCKPIDSVLAGCGCQTTEHSGSKVIIKWYISPNETGEITRNIFITFSDGTQDILQTHALT